MTLREDIERFTPALRRFARALVVHDPDDGPDIPDHLVQETILRSLKTEHGRRGPHLRTWLYSSLIQNNRARLRVAGSRANGAEAGANRAAGSHAPAMQHQNGITHALDRLPLDDREAILLVVLEELNYAQACEVLNVPRAALMARLVRARQALGEWQDGAIPQDARSRRKPPTHLRVVK